jgi:dolichol kinase
MPGEPEALESYDEVPEQYHAIVHTTVLNLQSTRSFRKGNKWLLMFLSYELFSFCSPVRMFRNRLPPAV